jgi:Ca2+-binding EF-hand superfamily protein
MRPLCNTTKEIKRMNKMITVATLLIAAMCQAEEPASAKKGLPHAGRPGHGMPPPEVMKELVAKFDKDGDGKLNETEMKAAREARQAEMLKKYDKDGDGKLNDEEMKPMREEMRLKHFDKDGDGKLSEEEQKAADAFKKQADGRHAEMLKKFDKDGDGKLSEEEMKAAHEARMGEMTKKFDKDGDGKLSDEEKATAKEAMKKAHEGKPRGERGEGPKGEGRKGGEKKDK